MSKSVKDLLRDKLGINSKIKEVDGYFTCSNNDLTSLEGSPEKVNSHFYCHNNLLTSLSGCPKEVGGTFSCGNNKKQFTEHEVKALCKVEYKIRV